MRIIKLLVVTLSVCFFASIIAGCSTNTPAASVEETTATTTAAPTPEPTSTPTPTPTPEPTATPTPIPTPPVKQWKTDKKLLGKWSFSNDTVKIEYQFNKDNTGVVKTTFNIKHMDTNEVETKTSESKFKYSYMGKGDKKKMNGKKIQFSKLIIVYENGNYKEYQYGISGKNLLMLDGAVRTNLKKK